tara:strand:+ start:73 stop:762 length:690 start_codon:yes stop_codon:yes gene_type:complete
MENKLKDMLKTDNYKYPSHFFSAWDDFTMHIPNWKWLFKKSKGQDNLNFLEIGTAQGRATVWLLEEVLNGKNSHIITVDVNRVQRAEKEGCSLITDDTVVDIDVVDNLKPYIEDGKCTFIESNSKTFLKYFTSDVVKRHENGALEIPQKIPHIFHCIYIDGSHDKADVLYDIINSFHLLHFGGVMILDDYRWGECGKGIDSFLTAYEDQITVLHKQDQVFLQRKQNDKS